MNEAALTDAEFWRLAEAEVRRYGRGALLKAMPGWAEIARAPQLPPAGDWRHWLMVGGRGSGKTRAGAEWVLGLVAGTAPFAQRSHGRIALVAETLADAREVMIDGESGIRTVAVGEKPAFEATRRRLVFANGAVAQVFSSEDPDSLRGYQFDAAWGDELAKWVRAAETFDNLAFALRLGRGRGRCSPRRRSRCRS